MKIYFFDSNVWLDLLVDEKNAEMLKGLYKKLNSDEILFIIPEQLIDELKRNYEAVIEKRKSSYNTYIKHTKKLLNAFKNDSFHNCLKDIEREYVNLHKEIEESTDKIFSLFWKIIEHDKNIYIQTTEEIILKAANRAISNRAPFHKNKNSMGDAILFESVIDVLNNYNYPTKQITFLTSNTKDFSDKKNRN